MEEVRISEKEAYKTFREEAKKEGEVRRRAEHGGKNLGKLGKADKTVMKGLHRWKH